jgi:hypothetical protein
MWRTVEEDSYESGAGALGAGALAAVEALATAEALAATWALGASTTFEVSTCGPPIGGTPAAAATVERERTTRLPIQP